jgi:hypothetical protein
MTISKIRLSALLKDGETLEQLVAESDTIISNSKKFVQPFESAKEITVTHNLNRKPSVTVIDSAGTEYKCQVNHETNDRLVVKLLTEISGTIYCA